jgi:non-specific serine/threonine protein kinase
MVLVDEPVPGRRGHRYRFSETIRQYAEEKLLEAGEAEELRRRHRDWYLDLAERARPATEGPDQKNWLDRLDDEHDNLRAALAWCAAKPDGSEALLRLAGQLGRFWEYRGHGREGIAWLDLALARAASTPSADRARVLDWRGWLPHSEMRWEQNLPILEESVAIARIAGDRRVLSMSLRHLSNVVAVLGDHPRGRRLAEEALEVSRAEGYKREIGMSHCFLANILAAAGNHGAAEALFLEGLAIGRGSGDLVTAVQALAGLSGIYRRRGDFARARTVLDEYLSIVRRLDVRSEIRTALRSLGNLARTEGNPGQAARWYRRSLQALVLAPMRGESIIVLRCYAAVLAELGNYHQAARLFGTVVDIDDSFVRNYPRTDPAYAFEADLAATREALGEAAFAAEWARGKAMTLEEAVDFALAEPIPG